MEYLITRLTDRPELKAQAAAWFHAKWGVPEQAYLDSMDDALRRAASVPQWYLAMEGPRIIGGMGVIENDFHDRKGLTDRKSTRLNSSHDRQSRMPSSA